VSGAAKKPDMVFSFTLDQLQDLVQASLDDAQSERAALGKLKRKLKINGPQDTIQDLVIDAMRRYWRDERGTLKNFIEAEFDEFTIAPMDNKSMSNKTKKYEVFCPAILPPRKDTKRVTLDTLYVWWGKVDKSL
jgi:hypothetical protein